jgi:hypothetical protein
MNENLLTVIARVRRAMPRNPDVMLVCDQAEKLYIQSNSVSSGSMGTNKPRPSRDLEAQPRAIGEPTISFDKKAYQREYMRKRRQK